jgi:hypothetical protein
MFYDIAEKFVETKTEMKIWVYLGINRCYWARIKKFNKLKLEYYKKICILADYKITDNQKELSLRLVEVFPWK